MIIRPFVPDDLGSVLLVQIESGRQSGWRGEDYLRLASDPTGLILLSCDGTAGEVSGFLALRYLSEHAEILNLAVRPLMRRLGIGKALLGEACRAARGQGVKVIWLEVRNSNEAALGLYRSFGFHLQSMRKGYYSDPAEDAQVLALELSMRPEVSGRG